MHYPIILSDVCHSAKHIHLLSSYYAKLLGKEIEGGW
jgi:hypothetical protein